MTKLVHCLDGMIFNMSLESKEFRVHPKSKYIVYEDGLIINPKTNYTIKQSISAAGYVVVGKYIGNTSGGVHRIVYEAFVGEIPKGLQINHMDGNKQNNHISNLELCTPSENTKHAYATGLAKGLRGWDNHISKMGDKDVLKMYNLFRGGCSNDEVALIHGHHSRYISLVRHGKRWEYLYPDEKLPESFDCEYSRETLLQGVMLLQLGMCNKDISDLLGIERSQVSRLRNRKCFHKFFYWYDNYFLKGFYVKTGETELYNFNV